MNNSHYPSDQPKNPVDDALVDRNSDPEAQIEPDMLKKHGDALLGSHPKPVKPEETK